MSAGKIAKEIQEKQARREMLWHEIEQIAKKRIPDYHFLDYKVSTFWSCEKSPIGMCVFKLHEGIWDPRRYLHQCRYCNGPVERK